ncbi:hypothetical protein TWF694_008386 [Orbilia ellipsospora]|uniref:B30.2/SPRY domain-containing protein n=1 Tax=Orbilia ellipsospora TaxID=2528407 RepID=A0AAV9XGW3_9PEZI
MTIAVKQRIYSTCNSIATMMELCIRLEQRSPVYESNAAAFQNISSPEINLWKYDIPELVFLMLDFLWHAKPHDTSHSLKVYGRAVKETFSGSLDQKATALLEHYEGVVSKSQVLYEDYLVRENLMARLKSDDLQKNFKEISGIAKELFDIAYFQSLKEELERQRAKISLPKSQEAHLKALSGRLDDIAGKRDIIRWLLDDETYKNWKTDASESDQLLCIEAPRGHGKSIAMMRLFRDLRTGTASESPPIVLRFFFKKGDHEIQKTQAALESLMYQFLHDDSIRNSLEVLENVVEVLNPSFGGDSSAGSTHDGGFWESPEKICDTIRKIAAVIPNRVFIMVDAFDECQDRREKNILKCLKLVIEDANSTQPASRLVKLIISARDTINIKDELQSAGYWVGKDNKRFFPGAGFIIIAKEKNSHDVREYLKYEVFQVLSRIIDPSKGYFAEKTESIVANIFDKASGDFTRARLIITHLQEPSKLPLEKKIERLPDSISDIYMASLEALTPNQQELVVCALKWVVWGVSGVTVMEISDHYRELYANTPSNSELETEYIRDPNDHDESNLLPFNEGNLGPEVKELIYHLSEAGRDFFRYDPTTGFVSVDISIREWITNDVGGRKSLKSSSNQGFRRYRDEDGYTVLKVTLNPSFVKYGDILSPLFNERDAQMALTLEIFRTLNNKLFQERYMDWMPCWYDQPSKSERYRTRYEIEHWVDHLCILQKWWSEGSIEDPWWSELLKEIDEFTKPENWYRWNVQREPEMSSRWAFIDLRFLREMGWYDQWIAQQHARSYINEMPSYIRSIERFLRFYQTPIHVASELGLHLLLDYLLVSKKQQSSSQDEVRNLPREPTVQSDALDQNSSDPISQAILKSKREYRMQKLGARFVIYAYRTDGRFKQADRRPMSLPNPRLDECDEVLNHALGYLFKQLELSKDPDSTEKSGAPIAIKLIKDILRQWDTDTRVLWLTNQLTQQPEFASVIELLATKNEIGQAEDLVRRHETEPQVLLTQWKDFLISQEEWEFSSNKTDGLKRVPLLYGALDIKVVTSLITHGANINAEAFEGTKVPLVNHLLGEMQIALGYLYRGVKSNRKVEALPQLRQTVRTLLNEGAGLDGQYYNEAGVLHLAASLHDLGLFRQICQLKTWDVLEKDMNGRTPLHYLLSKRPIESKTKEVIEILNIIIRMGSGVQDVVNAEDLLGRSPLVDAVRLGFKEAVDVLIEKKVAVRDEDYDGQNCFHHLTFFDTDPEALRSIANSLLTLNIDWQKRDNTGVAPLYSALQARNEALIHFLVEQYEKIGLETVQEDKLLPFENEPYLGAASGVLHCVAFLPYSKSTFESLQKIFPKSMDIYYRNPGLWKRPLESAIEAGNFNVASHILDREEYICAFNSIGSNEVDACCSYLLESHDPESISNLKSILSLFFEHASVDAIMALRYPLFEPNSPILTEAEQLALLSKLDYNRKDVHGWTITDLSHVMRFPEHLPLRESSKQVSASASYKTPSELSLFDLWSGDISNGSKDDPDVKLSESRVGITFDPEFPRFYTGDWGSDKTIRVAMADHPFPLSEKTSFFEVTFQILDDPEKATRERHKILDTNKIDGLFSIGLRSKHIPVSESPRPQFGIEYTSDGYVRVLKNIRDRDSEYTYYDLANGEIQNVAFDGTDIDQSENKNYVIGCGINYSDRKVFFTRNGKLLPLYFEPPDGQLFPIITLDNCTWSGGLYIGGLSVNFGASEFSFEDVNSPTWNLSAQMICGQQDDMKSDEKSYKGRMKWDAIQRNPRRREIRTYVVDDYSTTKLAVFLK